MFKRLAFAVGVVLAAAPAFAQSSVVIAGPGAPGIVPGASGDVTVTLASTVAGGIGGAQFRLCYNPAVLTAGTPVVAAGLAGVVCSPPTDVNCPGAPTTRGISCSGFSAATFTLPAAVTVPFTVAAGAAGGSTPLVFGGPPAVGFFDGNGNAVAPVTQTAGTFAVQGAVITPPNLAYNPTTVTGVAFPPGAPGAATSQIVVTPSGGSGTGADATSRVNNCALTGAGVAAGGFTITGTPNLSFVGNVTTPQSIVLGCTRAAVVNTATLTCDERRPETAAAVPRIWQLSCPVGVPVAGPTLAYLPAPPGPVAFGNVTVPANSVQNIAVTPSGGAGGGTTTLGSCAITGTNASEFTVASAATLTFTAGTNTPQNLGIRFTPVLPVGAKTASVACTETIQGGATSTRTWNLTGTSVQAPAQFSANPAPPGPVALGSVLVGQTASSTIVVTNSAAANSQNLPLTGCTIANAPGVTVSPTTLNLAPGASGNLVLSFAPTAGGALPAGANLTCTDPLSFEATRTWNLTGTGVVNPVTVVPGAGNPQPGSTINLSGSSSQTIAFVNSSAAAVALTCAVAPAGAFVVNPVPLSVPANGTASVTVSLNPASTGTAAAVLTCTPAVGAAVTFNLAGFVPAAVNTMSAVGLWAMLGLLLGTGLVVVATRKQ